MNFQSGPPCGRARSGVALLMLSDYIVPPFSRSAWPNNKKIHASTWQSACIFLPKLRLAYMNFQSGPPCGRARSGVALVLILSD